MKRPLIERILIWMEERLADLWAAYEAHERRKRRHGIFEDVCQEMEGDYQVDVREETVTTFTVSRPDNSVHLPRRRLN